MCNIPTIRFKDFTNEWIESKLGDVCEINPKSKLPDTFEYVDLESVVGTSLINHRHESKMTAPSRAQRLAIMNDIFYQTVRPYQQNNYLYDLPYKNYVFSSGYAQIRPSINSLFVMSQLQTNKFINNVLTLCTGTGYPTITAHELSNIYISIPSLEEQERIGSLFSKLDKIITNHEKQLDNLQTLKKASLQRMFPRDGKSKPELRFDGFTDDWIKTKLESIIVQSFKGKSMANMTGGDTLYLDANYLNGGKSIFIDAPQDTNINDILILWDGSKAGTVYRGVNGALGSTFKAYDVKANSEFIYQQLKYNQHLIYMKYRTPNIPHVIRNFTSEFIINIPSLEEQERIGNFFKRLDDKIKVQETKIEQLKLLKKGLLQHMFI